MKDCVSIRGNISTFQCFLRHPEVSSRDSTWRFMGTSDPRFRVSTYHLFLEVFRGL